MVVQNGRPPESPQVGPAAVAPPVRSQPNSAHTENTSETMHFQTRIEPNPIKIEPNPAKAKSKPEPNQIQSQNRAKS